MTGTFVDTNVLLDLFTDDPAWAQPSQDALEGAAARGPLFINAVVYAEASIGFDHIEDLEAAVAGCGLTQLVMPREALFLAGKAFLRYRRRGGQRAAPLPDFFIGAHAAVAGLPLLTRNAGRFGDYFPTVEIVAHQPLPPGPIRR